MRDFNDILMVTLPTALVWVVCTLLAYRQVGLFAAFMTAVAILVAIIIAGLMADDRHTLRKQESNLLHTEREENAELRADLVLAQYRARLLANWVFSSEATGRIYGLAEVVIREYPIPKERPE